MNKKTVVIATCIGLFVVGVVYAYFQSRKSIQLGPISTSTLEIALEQQGGNENTRLLPGETAELEWRVINTGTADSHLKGKVKALFSAPHLDPSMITVESVWRQDEQGAWQPVNVSGADNNEFYISQDGSEQNLITLVPQADEEYKVVVKLEENAGDEYQNTEFSTDVEMVAKQTNPSAPWPDFSE